MYYSVVVAIIKLEHWNIPYARPKFKMPSNNTGSTQIIERFPNIAKRTKFRYCFFCLFSPEPDFNLDEIGFSFNKVGQKTLSLSRILTT